MADWISQYTAALDVRDEREHAHKSYIDAYTKLADRIATLESAPPTPQPDPQSKPATQPPAAIFRTRQTSATTIDSATQQADLLSKLRIDLATTQRSRADLQTQLTRLTTDLSTLTTQSTASTTRITVLEREKRDLERRLRDRDEELRGKARLVEGVQDEMVGLNLQLNMAEQKAEKLKGENEELVRRWMKRMGEEAEKMNEESRWG